MGKLIKIPIFSSPSRAARKGTEEISMKICLLAIFNSFYFEFNNQICLRIYFAELVIFDYNTIGSNISSD